MTPTAPGAGISLERALEIARKEISESSNQHDFVLQEDRTVERRFGWVFFYTTRKYLETRDPQYLVPGNAPLAVLRQDGSIAHLATSVPPERAIEVYEGRWEESQHSTPPPPK
jgi:hypothetical protein